MHFTCLPDVYVSLTLFQQLARLLDIHVVESTSGGRHATATQQRACSAYKWA
jgi:hypothetical protein